MQRRPSADAASTRPQHCVACLRSLCVGFLLISVVVHSGYPWHVYMEADVVGCMTSCETSGCVHLLAGEVREESSRVQLTAADVYLSGCASQALAQHLGVLPDVAWRMNGEHMSWKAQTDVLLNRWQAQSSAGLQEAALHADAVLQTASSALATVQSQVQRLSAGILDTR